MIVDVLVVGRFTKVLGEVTLEEVVLSKMGGGDDPKVV
jgi:hypothetical protein